MFRHFLPVTTFGGHGLKRRIKNIAAFRKPKFWAILLSAALALAIGACTLTGAQSEAVDSSSSSTSLGENAEELEGAAETEAAETVSPTTEETEYVLLTSEETGMTLQVPADYESEFSIDQPYTNPLRVSADFNQEINYASVPFAFYDSRNQQEGTDGLVWGIVAGQTNISMDSEYTSALTFNVITLGRSGDNIYMLFFWGPDYGDTDNPAQYDQTDPALSQSYTKHIADGLDILNDFVTRNHLEEMEGWGDWRQRYTQWLLEPAEQILSELQPSDGQQETFFDLFHELDRTSMLNYVNAHPEVLSDGWENININEAGLSDGGTDIRTSQGNQVLAINASEGVLLIRMELESSRGVLAICKDASRLRLCAAGTLPGTGQTVGEICQANGGILSLTGSAFLDDGTSSGGQLSGLAICGGTEMGTPMGENGAKRLELRTDNKMYIVDSADPVDENTRDACEFQPALIVDGENVYGLSSWGRTLNPRAVLGQTKYLEPMLLVMEGRLTDSPGCTLDAVAEKLMEYDCAQAMNLDGGASAILYYDGEYVTRCSNTALPSGRTMPTAWVYGKSS